MIILSLTPITKKKFYICSTVESLRILYGAKKHNRFIANKIIIRSMKSIASKNTMVLQKNFSKLSVISISLSCESVKSFTVVNKRYMLTSLNRNNNSMQLAKETFLRFCMHFEHVNYETLHKDPLIISTIINSTTTNEDYYINRAFQLALEVSYSKRNFTRTSVLSHFEKYMSISNSIDPYDKTSDLDQSTLFSALQTKIVKERHPAWDLTVNQTPSTNLKLTELSPKEQNLLEQNKILTENRFPDVSINGVMYDYKFSKELYNTKNQIYMMPESVEAFKKFGVHINNLSKVVSSPQRTLSEDFRAILKEKLQHTQQEFNHTSDSQSKFEIIDSWNDFLIKTADQRPKDFGISLFFITKNPYRLDPSLLKDMEKVHLPEGHLDAVKAKKAMIGIVDNLPKKTQNSIYEATRGALGHLFTHDTDNNI